VHGITAGDTARPDVTEANQEADASQEAQDLDKTRSVTRRPASGLTNSKFAPTASEAARVGKQTPDQVI
jgi:hypothetical protein